MTYSCCTGPRTLSFHPAFHHLGHLGLFEPADFTNCLLKFYSLNKSVNSEKWGPRPSTGHRNVSLLQRLTPDVIKWVHHKLRVIRAVRFNESLHRCSFLCSLIRVWSFFFFFPCTGFPPKSFTLLLMRARRKEAAQLFYHRLFAGSCAGISSLCHVMYSIVIQHKKAFTWVQTCCVESTIVTSNQAKWKISSDLLLRPLIYYFRGDENNTTFINYWTTLTFIYLYFSDLIAPARHSFYLYTLVPSLNCVPHNLTRMVKKIQRPRFNVNKSHVVLITAHMYFASESLSLFLSLPHTHLCNVQCVLLGLLWTRSLSAARWCRVWFPGFQQTKHRLYPVEDSRFFHQTHCIFLLLNFFFLQVVVMLTFNLIYCMCESSWLSGKHWQN